MLDKYTVLEFIATAFVICCAIILICLIGLFFYMGHQNYIIIGRTDIGKDGIYALLTVVTLVDVVVLALWRSGTNTHRHREEYTGAKSG